MYWNLIKKYARFFTICAVLLKFGVVSINVPEWNCEQEYLIIKKQYRWLTLDFFYKIYFYSKRYQLPPTLICSLMTAESYCRKYRPTLYHMKYAVSKSNARGIMQIMPFHHHGHPNDLFKMDLNLTKGMSYLKKCLYSSNGNLKEALRKYNQGINGRRSKYKGWNTYVKPIVRRYEKSLLYKNKQARGIEPYYKL